MARLEIKLNNKVFPVECEDSQKEIVKNASELITRRFEKLKEASPVATTEYLLMLTALSLQGEMLTEDKENSPENSAISESFYESLKEISESLENFLKK